MNRSIAIDGPSGSGKSTLAGLLAEKLNMLHLDTGAMYRSLALLANRNGIDYHDEQALNEILEAMNFSIRDRILLLNDQPIDESIRDPEISKAASIVSAHPCIRTAMQEKQRDLSRLYPLIMDGRDIGAYVLPDAAFKFFIDADVEERARRRYLQEMDSGISYERVLEELIHRDRMDREREVAPLRMADDAIQIDNTNLEKEETLALLIRYVEESR